MAELKPCPFCGDDNAVIQAHHTGRSTRYSVVCRTCYAMTNVYEAEDLAAEAWNRRKLHD